MQDLRLPTTEEVKQAARHQAAARPLAVTTDPARDRLTLSIQIAHERPGRPASGTRAGGAMILSSTGSRSDSDDFDVGPEPVPVMQGLRVDPAGYVVVENITGQGRMTQPSEEERKVDAAAVAVLEYDGHEVGYVWPSGPPSANDWPDPKKLTVRCGQGPRCTVRVTAIPR